MLTIKRYPNRKLYNTETKQYITLDGIAELIRDGEEVQVLDHASGEDLTALTLTQIIFEQEKKQSGFLPHNVLTGLVQAGGDTLASLRRTLASPLGILRQIDDEIVRRVDALVKLGKFDREYGHELTAQLLAAGHQPGESGPAVNEEELHRILDKRGVPTGEDFRQLLQQIDTLAGKLDGLKETEAA
jgi:polyhydroxyalkanoate synthesis repressor PhaR